MAIHPTKSQNTNNNYDTGSEQHKDDSIDQRNPKRQLEEKLRKCLSTKAIKIGKEHGVTAEFIIQQTSE